MRLMHYTRRMRIKVLQKLILYFFLFAFHNAYAQTRKASGTVIDSLQKPVSGATIAVKGAKAKVVASSDGIFSINAKLGDVLTVSAVGFLSREVLIDSLTNINISLSAVINSLNDVIVVGYGTQRKASVTGAISSINASEIVKTPATTTSAALVGKVPGVTARAYDSRPSMVMICLLKYLCILNRMEASQRVCLTEVISLFY